MLRFPHAFQQKRVQLLKGKHRDMQQDVKDVYRTLIDEVISKVMPEFSQEGLDDVVLEELRLLWEKKLLESGALDPDPTGMPANMAANSGYPAGVPGPQYAPHAPYMAGGYPPAAFQPPAGGGPSASAAQGWTSESRKRRFDEIAQDGVSLKKEEGVGPGSSPVVTTGGQGGRSYPYSMPQQDGSGDDHAVAKREVKEEDDDDLAGLDTDEDEDEKFENRVIAQFEKVNRTKNRWKCSLKDGVMHLNGQDYLFSKATGEMQF